MACRYPRGGAADPTTYPARLREDAGQVGEVGGPQRRTFRGRSHHVNPTPFGTKIWQLVNTARWPDTLTMWRECAGLRLCLFAYRWQLHNNWDGVQIATG